MALVVVQAEPGRQRLYLSAWELHLELRHAEEQFCARGPRSAPAGPPGAPTYLMLLYTLNSGRYIETTITPTIPPTRMIIAGSMIEVRALIAADTSSS